MRGWTPTFRGSQAARDDRRQRRDASTLRVGYPTTPRYHLATLIAGIVRAAEARFGNRVIFEFVGWWPDEVATAANVRTFLRLPDMTTLSTSLRLDSGMLVWHRLGTACSKTARPTSSFASMLHRCTRYL